MLWLALKPTQARHIVVSVVRTSEFWSMLTRNAGSRGVSFVPQNVKTRWATPRSRMMLALIIIRTIANKVLSFSKRLTEV